ncbi:hypothetical protein PtrV1_00236 [Pyrenophora tritici-repentis]|nr:hypothetical protein PtrV1_00236 [Pyrenophora tritici-repentis]
MALSPLVAALVEAWTLYGIGSIAIILRIFTRTRMVGIAGWQADDYIIFFSWACYTGMTVAAHEVGGVSDTSHMTMEYRLSLTPEQAALHQRSSKWFMVGWFTYIGLIWSLKLNMLFLYRRVVSVVWVSAFLLPTMLLVGVTGISIWLMFALACRPFNRLWQILPDPGQYCMPQSPAFLVLVLVFNLLTDVFIILIPIPIILPLKISWARKLGLLAMFCAGIFIMIAAILRVYFVMALQQAATAAIWSCREDIVAVLVGQATIIRPLFTHRFWTGAYEGSNSYPSNKNSDDSHELSDGSASKQSRLGFRAVKDPYNISALHTNKGNESQEKIIPPTPDVPVYNRRESVQRIDTSGKDLESGHIVIQREVAVSTATGKHEFPQAWKPV